MVFKPKASTKTGFRHSLLCVSYVFQSPPAPHKYRQTLNGVQGRWHIRLTTKTSRPGVYKVRSIVLEWIWILISIHINSYYSTYLHYYLTIMKLHKICASRFQVSCRCLLPVLFEWWTGIWNYYISTFNFPRLSRAIIILIVCTKYRFLHLSL